MWRELPLGLSVGGLMERLQAEGAVSEAAMRSVAVAVNHEYAGVEQVLEDGDEVAILPPVSGGSGFYQGQPFGGISAGAD